MFKDEMSAERDAALAEVERLKAEYAKQKEKYSDLLQSHHSLCGKIALLEEAGKADYRKALMDIGSLFIRGDILVDDESDKRGRILKKIGDIINKALFEEAPAQICEHVWQDLGDSAKGFTKKCRNCDRLEV